MTGEIFFHTNTDNGDQYDAKGRHGQDDINHACHPIELAVDQRSDHYPHTKYDRMTKVMTGHPVRRRHSVNDVDDMFERRVVVGRSFHAATRWGSMPGCSPWWRQSRPPTPWPLGECVVIGANTTGKEDEAGVAVALG